MTPKHEKRMQEVEERAKFLDGFPCPYGDDVEHDNTECLHLQGEILFDIAWLVAVVRADDERIAELEETKNDT